MKGKTMKPVFIEKTMNNEPVAWMFKHKKVVDFNKPNDGDDNWIPLYTHPADLTDEEIDELWDKYLRVRDEYGEELQILGVHEFVDAILRKAQEK